ncbi:MAG: type III-A CRISPR-associated RAMP protein Csm5 [Methanobrevibacter sp.]|jgi:CRISPR type III-A-associated RAMP protein Csm5|nr:type III-A CRISPR-associated RAMP protein Csm5 [Candidatus Methanovirga meridionalis]
MLDSNIKTYNCKIQTLTPVHIGSGKTYNSSEYFDTKAKSKGEVVNIIRRISFDKYYLNLSDERKDEFINSIADSKFKLKDFDSKINREFRRYESINRSGVIPDEIVEHLKTMDEMYVPGSSLKGAIKTALLYQTISKEDVSNIRSLIRRDGRGIDRRSYTDFVNGFFSSNRGGRAAQYDISKFLQISDSTTLKNPQIYTLISIMAQSDEMDGFKEYKRHQTTVSTYLETIPNKKLLESKISTNYNSKTYRSLKMNKEKEEMIDIDNIKKAIYNFSKDFIEYEIEFLDKYSYSDLDKNIPSKIIKFYKKLNEINSLEAPILKIGSGSGFMATTIGIKIKQFNPQLFEEIRKLLRGKNYPYEFPKSRKIIKEKTMPLGWVRLKIE